MSKQEDKNEKKTKKPQKTKHCFSDEDLETISYGAIVSGETTYSQVRTMINSSGTIKGNKL